MILKAKTLIEISHSVIKILLSRKIHLIIKFLEEKNIFNVGFKNSTCQILTYEYLKC